MPSSLLPRTPAQNVLITAAQAVGKAGVSALCFILWDTIIHLADEIEFMWSSRNTWAKFMYFFIRYVPIIVEASLLSGLGSYMTGAHFSARICRDWVIYQLSAFEVITIAVEIVLIVRMYALYNHNRAMLWTLSGLFLAEIATMLIVLSITIPRIEFGVYCFITATPKVFMAYWLSSLAFETFLFMLTLFSLFASVRCGLGKHSVLYIFMRDGTWAFAFIFLIMLLNTLMYRLNDTPLSGICYFWALSVMSFSGAHVLLNLRRVATPGFSKYTFPTDLGETAIERSGVSFPGLEDAPGFRDEAIVLKDMHAVNPDCACPILKANA